MAHSGELIATDIETYLRAHENKDFLRFITCGSVDDGKSTLIGRLLHDSKMIFEDQLQAIQKDSKKHGTTGEDVDLALLVDGLASEREQGITIDVAYRFFSTDKKKYIIADTPGHEQYTRNMATGASTADLAVILIDARQGVLTQTKRHSYIVTLLGIKHLVVAINKMDLVDYSQTRFEEIRAQYESEVLDKLPTKDYALTTTFMPISALKGDNVVNTSQNMPWFEGVPLMRFLDDLQIEKEEEQAELRLPVQYVNRPNSDFRGFCGTIASGVIQVGDAITVLPSGKSTRVKSILLPAVEERNAKTNTAQAKTAVTITTEDEVDISRGDMIVGTEKVPRLSNSLKVMLIWMSETVMRPQEGYLIKTSASSINARFEHINYKFDVNTYEKLKVNELHLNDIASCKLVLNSPIVADTYRKNRTTGSFIVVDRMTNNTVAAGMIVDVSRREHEEVGEQHRAYTDAEIELNAYIRKNFPEWGCKAV